jgi:hypothetical protein
MTDQRLRDLLHDSVHDAEMPDVSEAAWRGAGRARRRRAVAGAAGVVAVALTVGATVWAADHTADRRVAPTQRPTGDVTPTPAQGPSTAAAPYRLGAKPDARVRGLGRVWWGPDPGQEAGLPQWPSVVPPRIDLAADAPDLADHPVRRAMAAFAVFTDAGPERVVVMTQSGALRSVDVSRLSKVTKPNGYRLWPETQSMLSPAGTYLVFPQDGHVETLRLSTGRWARIDTGAHDTSSLTWTNDTDLLLSPPDLESEGPTYDVVTGRRSGASADVRLVPSGVRAFPYGRERESPGGAARTYDSVSGRVPVRPGSLDMGEGLVVRGFDGAGDRDVLTFTSPAQATRSKQCCSVAGWLDGDRVVYESKGETPRLVAWRVGTHDLGRIATISGVDAGREYYVSSWARLWGRWPAR